MKQNPDDIDLGPALLERWQQHGDVEALDELLRLEVAELKVRIRDRGRGILRSNSVSDVVHEAVVRVLKTSKRPRFENPRVFRAYLWRAAERLLLDRLRRRKVRGREIDVTASRAIEREFGVSGGQSAVERRDLIRQLRIALSLIEPGARHLLEETYFAHRSLDDIAGELGITRDAAKMRIVRAKRLLKKKLDQWHAFIDGS